MDNISSDRQVAPPLSWITMSKEQRKKANSRLGYERRMGRKNHRDFQRDNMEQGLESTSASITHFPFPSTRVINNTNVPAIIPIAELLPLRRDVPENPVINPFGPRYPGFHYITPLAHMYNHWGDSVNIIEESTPIYVHLTYADRMMLAPVENEDSHANPITLYRVAASVVFPIQNSTEIRPQAQQNNVQDFGVEMWD